MGPWATWRIPGHHHHVLCRRCNRSMEFGGHEDLDDLTTRVQAETGYVISEHLLQFMGYAQAARHCGRSWHEEKFEPSRSAGCFVSGCTMFTGRGR